MKTAVKTATHIVPALEAIRCDKLIVGTRYSADIHGVGTKVLKLVSKPDVPVSRMGPNDAYVFETAGRNPKEVIFRSHMCAGPKFLVTEVESPRGTRKARVTFHERVRA